MENRPVQAELFLPDGLSASVRQALSGSPDRLYRENGKIYLSLGRTVLCCPDDPAGNKLAETVLRDRDAEKAAPETQEDIYRAILLDPGFSPDASVLKKHRIAVSADRCVVVFDAPASMLGTLLPVFDGIAPLENGDVTVSEGCHTVALIRDMKFQTREELKEYTEAVIGSMESEGFSGIRAGIGMKTDSIGDLRKSFLTAREALSLGIKYHGRESVHDYDGMTLERIMECIPHDRLSEIRREFLNRGDAGGMPDELLETVRVFFRNDLNLTAASRELFVHRNTLNYRLDKIRKETGLDLRSFRDAVIFQILSGIPDEL